MQSMFFLFDVDATMLLVWGYRLSWLEFFGTATGLVCVWLTARERLLGWMAGIINAALFLLLFLQVGLYSDMLLQVFYIVTSVYGWWRWANPRTKDEANARSELRVRSMTTRELAAWFAAAAAGSLILGFVTARLPSWLPTLFKEPAVYPYADALVASLSVCATFVMAEKKIQCWVLWIIVDAIAVVLYASRGIHFMAAEYFVFGVICVSGLAGWKAEMKRYAYEI